MTNINVLAENLALAMDNADRANQAAAEAAEFVASLRADLHAAMQDGSYKTFEGGGLKASRRTKDYPAVVDQDALEAHLRSLGRFEEYLAIRLDTTKVKRDGVKNGWPGIEVETRDELVIKRDAA